MRPIWDDQFRETEEERYTRLRAKREKKAIEANNLGWKSMDSAPLDGREIIGRNRTMAESHDAGERAGVRMSWGRFKSVVSGRVWTDWHTSGGDLVCPSEWRDA